MNFTYRVEALSNDENEKLDFFLGGGLCKASGS